MIKDNQMATLAKCPFKKCATNNPNGICAIIARKDQISNIFKGIETIYSWKNADTMKTAQEAWNREYPR